MVTRRQLWLRRLAALACLALLFLWPALGLSIFGVWCAYLLLAMCYFQTCLGRSLERSLGFRLGKQHLHVGRRRHFAVAIRWIAADGAFARAGFREDDVLPGISFTDFFRRLHSHRGRVVELAVVDGGEGPPLDKRPQRVVRIGVPSIAECPPTRQDAILALSVLFPIVFGAIGCGLGWLTLDSLEIANSPPRNLAILFTAGNLGTGMGLLACNPSLKSDHHDDVLMPNRG